MRDLFRADKRDQRQLPVFGRLKPGATLAQAQAELAAVGFVNADNAIGAAHAPADGTLDPRSRLSSPKSLHMLTNMAG